MSENTETTETPVYVAGGTVQAAGGVYLERAADSSLLKLCRDGAFAFVLTSRQMGKSSLMIRTAERLYAENVRSVIVDLTNLGAEVTADQWYKGFLITLEDQLGLSTNTARWWQEHQELGVAHRFNLFLRKVVLAEVPERVVIFVDEIDTTLRLPFTDDFFTAIRYLYNARADTPELARLSFVLIGVATPGDLIKDPERTPFNIGQRVELTDFTLAEARPLLAGLPLSAEDTEQVLRRVLYWTSGHPYLTLRLFRSFTDKAPEDWTEKTVARRVAELYFGTMTAQDSNLQFVRDMLTKKAFDPAAVLETYRAIRRGRKVRDEELSLVKSWLKLSGVVCPDTGLLRVRNRIYETVFTTGWVRQHQRINWPRLLARIGLAIVVLLVMVALPLAGFAWRQKEKAEASLIAAKKANRNADRQRLHAEGEAEKAKQAWAAAVQARTDALQQKEKAEEEAAKARAQEKRTEEEKKRVDFLRQLAEKNAKDASNQSHEAERQKQRADEARLAAESARVSAEKSAADASRFKEIALARGLAGSSSSLRGTRADRFALSSLLAAESLRRSPVMPAAEQILRESQPLLPTVIGRRQLPAVSALSPDGSRAVVVRAGMPQVADTRTGRKLAQLPSDVERFNFSPDGRRLFGYSRTGLALWDADSGREVAQLWDRAKPVPEKASPEKLSGALRPSLRAAGNNLIYSDSSVVQVWNLADGKRALRIAMKPGSRVLAVDAGARRVAILESDGEVSIWKAERGKLSELHHVKGVIAAAFTPDGSRLALATGDAVGVWDLKGSRELFRFSLREAISMLAFSPDAKWILAAGRDGSLRVWGATGGQDAASLPHDGPVESMDFSHDVGRLVTVTSGKVIRVWRTDSWTELARLGFESFIGFSPDGERLVTTRDATMETWKVGNREGELNLRQFDSINAGAFCRDGTRLAIGRQEGITEVLEVASGKTIALLRQVDPVLDLKLSADSSRLLTRSEDLYRLWDVGSAKGVATLKAEGANLAMSGDGRLIATAEDGRGVRIRELPSGTEKVLLETKARTGSLLFTLDGKRLATVADDFTVHVWDVESGREVAQLSQKFGVTAVAFSPDGRRLAIAGIDKTSRLWDIATGATLRLVQEGTVLALAFSVDGRWLVTGSADATARIWDVESGKEMARISRRDMIGAVTFTADGRGVELLEDGGHLSTGLWRIEDLIAQTCQRLRRNLSRQEWEQYLGDEPYRETCPGVPVPASP